MGSCFNYSGFDTFIQQVTKANLELSYFWSKCYIKQTYLPFALERVANLYDMTWHPDEHSIYSAILASEAGSMLKTR